MFGISFLFGSILLALPLAGLPVLLHLLFRRKSPVVMFPTLRFVRSSLQHTAARRRIQRWVLLAVRVLMLVLLILAIAQPVKILAASWFDTKKTVIAAIVLDTSYSMLHKEREVALDKANAIVQELLRGPLKDARVAVLKTAPPADGAPPQLDSPTAILKDWVDPKPEYSPQPLTARVAQAADLLKRQPADQKWLVIVSDLQAREFPHALPTAEGTRVVLFDLHADEVASDGLTGVHIEPEQPIPGIGTNAVAEVAGRGGKGRAVKVVVTKLDGTPLKQKPEQVANLDAAGRTQVRFDLEGGLPLPTGAGGKPEPWLLVRAVLQGDDAMKWDDARTQLVQIPPRQTVTVFPNPARPDAVENVKLILDPWRGANAAWPVAVRSAPNLGGQEQVAIAVLSQWPEESAAVRLRDFARAGNSVVLMLQPGLERAWGALSEGQKAALGELLPAPPAAADSGAGVFRAAAAASADPLLEGLTDKAFDMSGIVVRRFVPLAAPQSPDVTAVINISPANPGQGARTHGLLYRRTLGGGAVFTLATLPDAQFGEMHLHPLLLPIMVRMSLRAAGQGEVQNTEVGQPLVLAGRHLANNPIVRLRDPSGASYEYDTTTPQEVDRFVLDKAENRLTYTQTNQPGLYYWTKPDGQPIAIANVQLPGQESELAPKPTESVLKPGPDAIIARSYGDFVAGMQKVSEPLPQWSLPIAIVLLLLCAEALLASLANFWKPVSLRSLIPGFAAGAAK